MFDKYSTYRLESYRILGHIHLVRYSINRYTYFFAHDANMYNKIERIFGLLIFS